MEYYYVIEMDEFWKLESSIIKFVHQKLPSKDYILVRVSSELTIYDEQFESIDQFNDWSVENGFNPADPVNEPITPYIPEADDPILR
jgi:hypothetical protein